MMKGLICSLIYIMLSFGIAMFFLKISKSTFLTRKLLHILMANWWFIFLRNIEDKILILGPVSFIIINYLIERSKKKGYGMTMFAVSLSAMTTVVLLNVRFLYSATLAILILGYADPIAAIVGRSYQNYKGYIHQKSLLGSGIFSMVSIAIMAGLLCYINIELLKVDIILWGCLFAWVEQKVFPRCDNITVPFSVFIVAILRGKICGLLFNY